LSVFISFSDSNKVEPAVSTEITAEAAKKKKATPSVPIPVKSGEVVIEATTLRVIKGSNIDLRLPMASTTKAMTALVVIEKCSPDAVVTIPKEAVGIEGSSIYLREGEKLTVKELLFGLMLRSGNDAATALAIYAGGSVENFAEMMNGKAVSLGLKNTHFTNPHGLQDENHYTSAYDLAVIAAAGMNNPLFREIVSTKFVTISGNDEEQLRYFHNKNKILSMYRGGNGVKTGYTKAAGRCLVAASEREGMQLVSVVLNVNDMWNVCMGLMDYAYENYKMTKVIDKTIPLGTISVVRGKKETVEYYAARDRLYPLKRDGSEKVTVTIDAETSMKAPHHKGKPLGTVEVKLDNRLLFSENLYTIENVERKGLFDFLKK
jgi:D-alanyl-D-alanine carboxypeptidase